MERMSVSRHLSAGGLAGHLSLRGCDFAGTRSVFGGVGSSQRRRERLNVHVNDGAIYRRCGCRDQGSGRQWSASCPRLADRAHGCWYFAVQVSTVAGGRAPARRGGYTSPAAAERARQALLALPDPVAPSGLGRCSAGRSSGWSWSRTNMTVDVAWNRRGATRMSGRWWPCGPASTWRNIRPTNNALIALDRRCRRRPGPRTNRTSPRLNRLYEPRRSARRHSAGHTAYRRSAWVHVDGVLAACGQGYVRERDVA